MDEGFPGRPPSGAFGGPGPMGPMRSLAAGAGPSPGLPGPMVGPGPSGPGPMGPMGPRPMAPPPGPPGSDIGGGGPHGEMGRGGPFGPPPLGRSGGDFGPPPLGRGGGDFGPPPMAHGGGDFGPPPQGHGGGDFGPSPPGRGGGMAGGRGRGRFGGGGGGGGGRGPPPPRRDVPRNPDYSQNFVDTGQRPQNNLRDASLADLYHDYPQLKELIQRKDALVAARATPPYYLRADLRELPLSVETFGTKFDVVLIDPPWEEYARRASHVADEEAWPWQQIIDLDIGAITDTPSFVFLWCGSAEGLDAGRHCLRKWGFRRCEDICWIKTNADPATKSVAATRADPNAVLQHTKEHCLMGIKGNVRRGPDGHVIHANIDTDIIVTEEPPFGSTRKPEDLYAIIEHFALGRRRLELFGEEHNIRPGWVTVGKQLNSSNFNPQVYASHFALPDGTPYVQSNGKPRPGAPHLLGTTPEIEEMRPKSPPR